MTSKQRKTIRTRREQLLTLLNGWDPAGLLNAGAPRDEYDCVVDQLLSLLSRQTGEEEVAQFIESEIRDHFGRTPQGAAQFATKAVAWFRMLSAEE